MKRKIFIILLFTLFIIGCSGHKHNYNITTYNPTCLTEGYTLYTCECGHEYKDNIQPKLSHEYGQWVIISSPTITDEGLKQKTCFLCNDILSEIIPVIDHDHEYIKEIIPSTCVDKGYTLYTCSACGESYKEDYKDPTGHSLEIIKGFEATCVDKGLTDGKKCAICNEIVVKQEEIFPLGHNYVQDKVLIEPTITSKGKAQNKCTICNDIIEVDIPVLGHDHNYIAKIVNPTCTEKGYTEYKCECGDSYVRDYKNATGHKFGSFSIIKQPTDLETGKKERTCSVCKTKEFEEIPKLEHTHNYTKKIVEPTCTTKGYTDYSCKCGDSYQEKYVNALGHKNIVLTSQKPTCTETGLTEGKKCTVCNEITVAQTIIPALGHSYNEWVVTKKPTSSATGRRQKTCSICGNVVEEIIPISTHTHSYEKTVQSATCEEGGKIIYTCKCGDSYTQEYSYPLGHTWVIEEVVEATCSSYGYTSQKCALCNKSEKTDVTELNNSNHKIELISILKEPTCTSTGVGKYECILCGGNTQYTSLPIEHKLVLVSEIKPATCTIPGVGKYACSLCKEELGYKQIPAEHDMKTINVISKATCISYGEETQKCNKCGYIETVIIKPNSEHNYVKTTLEATCVDPKCTLDLCTFCGDRQNVVSTGKAKGHKIEEVVLEATCTDPMCVGYICTVCNYKQDVEYIGSALGHDFGSFVVDYEPTTSRPGRKSRHCSRCKEVTDITIIPILWE